MNITDKIEKFLDKYKLNTSDKVLIVAFSGGYDSMCLLHIINNLSKKYKFTTVAIHLNHGWRGDESNKEELKCKNFCETQNIKFYSETLESSIKKTETAAREARYKFFEKYANKLNSDCILTAHNADDNAETVLYRLVKGTGIYGLEGIKEQRGIFYRPLLNVYREEIEQYCLSNNLSPNQDSSNSNTKYKRNLIRHEIFPILSKINPSFKESINSLSEIAQLENEYFNKIILKIYNNNKINTKDYIDCPIQLKQRIIHSLYQDLNLNYDKERIEYILNFIEENISSKSGKTCSLTSDLWLYVNNKKIYTIKKSQKENSLTKILNCGEYFIDNYKFSIFPKTELDKLPKDEDNTALVDFTDFNINFDLRHRKNGDLIQPLGMSGRQKLKKYLNNKKIPNHIKDSLLFLCVNNEVLWAPSIGISNKIKVRTKPTHILKLEKIKE